MDVLGNFRRNNKASKIALLLVSTGASGTERRMANVFLQLNRHYPGQYLLITNLGLAEALERAGFGLAELENVFVLGRRSILDRKRGGQAALHVNAGRLLTLLAYRRQTKSLLQQHRVDTLQVFLEMVPFLGIFPIPGVRMIASLVSHLPKYYTRGSFSCRLLLRSLHSYQGIDALSPSIAGRLGDLGVAGSKISFPKWNCVDTHRFRPSPKKHTVTFTSRALAFKNPLLMLSVIELVLIQHPRVKFYILGQGPLQARLERLVQSRGLNDSVIVDHLDDPSSIVNRSMVHVCIEDYDNATNQSLLEGMASGCAIVASDVGETQSVVTPDVGMLVSLEPRVVAHAVSHLLAHPELCNKMGRAARRKAEANHHVNSYLEYLTRLHRS